MISVEYLFVMSKNDTFCSNVEAFKNLLRADTSVEIEETEIVFQKTKFKYEFFIKDIEDKDERFFDLRFMCSSEAKIVVFNQLLRTIRASCSRIKGTLNLIWDDTSLYYAKKAYPIVYRIENLLRKLITKFMLTSIGSDWAKKMIPDEVKVAANKQTKKRVENNPLFEVDFITLSDFLFKPYHTNSIEALLEEIKGIDAIEKLALDKLKSYVPRSNWERFFSKIVSCEDAYLIKRWSRLYELRCLIAHNAFLTQEDFKDTEKISQELEAVFIQALDSLDKLSISKEEEVEIVESLSKESDRQKATINYNWRQNVEAVKNLFAKIHPELDNSGPSRILVGALKDEGILSEDFENQYIHLMLKKHRVSKKESISAEELESFGKEVIMFGINNIYLEEPFDSAQVGIDYQ